MTVHTPEAVDLTDLAGLDFATPQLCDVNECHDDKITARPAVALLVRAMLCCTETAPICQEHADGAQEAREDHRLVLCVQHRLGMCSHVVLRIEPLP